MRGFWLALILAAGIGFSAGACGQAGTVSSGSRVELTPQEIVRRDALLQPGVDAMKKNDPATALTAFRMALAAFPNDLKTLRYSALAAMDAHRDEEALGLFQRVLAQHPVDPWATRFAVMDVEARLGRWSEFDADLAALKSAKKGDDSELKSPGFIVDEFEVNGTRVRVAFFPLLAGRYHTLYRFLLPEPAKVDTAASTQTSGDRCKDPKFQPYIDVESDDVDQGELQDAAPGSGGEGRTELLAGYVSGTLFAGVDQVLLRWRAQVRGSAG